MEGVGGGVAAGDRLPAVGVDLGVDRVVDPGLARHHPGGVDREALQAGPGVGDLEHGPAPGPDQAGVADLAAALGVERRPVQDQLDLVALAGRGQLLAVAEQPQDAALGGGGLVADEGGAAVAAGQVPVGVEPAQVGVQLPAGLLGPAALVVHELAEAVGVDVQARLPRRLQGQLVGEPVGVVELEGGVAGEHGRALLPGPADGPLEQGRALAQGARERLLLAGHHLLDQRALGDQLRPGLAQVGHHLLADAGQGRVLDPEQAQVPDRAAQQPAQDVAPALVGGQHPVGDEEAGRAAVLGDDPQRPVDPVLPAVAGPRQLLDLVEHGGEQVGLVHRVGVLEDHRHPLQAHAGVDVLLRQLADDRVVLAVALAPDVLHEHQVPDLEIALGLAGRAAAGAEGGAAVVVDLRAGPARAGHAHVPVVVLLAEALDALGGHADLAPAARPPRRRPGRRWPRAGPAPARTPR